MGKSYGYTSLLQRKQSHERSPVELQKDSEAAYWSQDFHWRAVLQYFVLLHWSQLHGASFQFEFDTRPGSFECWTVVPAGFFVSGSGYFWHEWYNRMVI